MSISAADVKTLRDRTGMQMMKCKQALVEADGDMEKAVELLRKQSKEAQAKSADRPTAEGRVAVFIEEEQQVGAIIEVQCETAPVSKSDQFIALANDLARQVVSTGASTPEELLAQPFVDDPSKTVKDHIGDVIGLIRENMQPARMARFEGQMGHYVHHDGSVGVLMLVEGDKKGDPEVLRDVCMHIAAQNPAVGLREEVSEEVIAKEKEIIAAQIAADEKNQGKPANIIERIAEGKMKTWFAENVLVEQPFVKETSKTVGEVLKSTGVKLVKFVRYRVGT